MAARGAGTGTWPYSNGLDLKPSWLGGWLFDVLPGAVLLDGDDAVEGDAVARGGGLDGGAVGEHAADVAHVVGGELVADDDAGAVVALVAAGGQHDGVVGVVVAVVVVDVVNLEAGGDGALVGAVDEAVGEGRDLPAVAVDADADVAGGVQPFGAMGLAGDGGVGSAGLAVAAADAPDAAFVVDSDKPEEDEAVEGLALVDGGAGGVARDGGDPGEAGGVGGSAFLAIGGPAHEVAGVVSKDFERFRRNARVGGDEESDGLLAVGGKIAEVIDGVGKGPGAGGVLAGEDGGCVAEGVAAGKID